MDTLQRFFIPTPNPSAQPGPQPSPKPQQQRRNNNIIYGRPLPLKTHPLPPVQPSNPLSYLHLLYALLLPYFRTLTSHGQIHAAYYSPLTRSIHVTGESSIRALWEQGFFGKGSLSRSEPEWLERERKRLGLVDEGRTAGEVTRRRREERRVAKRERARVEREELEEQLRKEGKLLDASHVAEEPATEANGNAAPSPTLSSTTKTDTALLETTPRDEPPTILRNQEHLQLTPHEALYLHYTLGVLDIHPTSVDSTAPSGNSTSPPTPNQPLTTPSLLALFRRTATFPPYPSATAPPPDDPFITSYAVYHHFRSLGWVVRPGIKFAVDWLLYARGPVFSHAEFAVVIMPSYTRWPDNEGKLEREKWAEKGEWWHFHAISRVQSQVMKSLVLVYVDVPTAEEVSGKEDDLGALLRCYWIREFVLRRWTPNRNRD